MKIRAFLAFDISQEARAVLARLIDDFSRKERGIKWVSAGNMHVTMKFFGNVEEELLLGDVAEALRGAVGEFRPAVLQCAGIGVFPNWKYPRVIWAGFSGDSEGVLSMHEAIEKALSGFKLHEDKRRFRLHLTIGRARGVLKDSKLVSLVEKLGPISFGEVRVDRFVLYKSMLTKQGSVYTPLREFRFGSA